jgi:hypothetical protein
MKNKQEVENLVEAFLLIDISSVGTATASVSSNGRFPCVNFVKNISLEPGGRRRHLLVLERC